MFVTVVFTVLLSLLLSSQPWKGSTSQHRLLQEGHIHTPQREGEIRGSEAVGTGHRAGWAAEAGPRPRSRLLQPGSHRPPPRPAPICRRPRLFGAGSSPSSGPRARAAEAAAHAGLHVGRPREEPHVSGCGRPPARGRPGRPLQAAGARPRRLPGRRPCGARTLLKPSRLPEGGLSPFRPQQPSQNSGSPSRSRRRKIRMAAALVLEVFLSFAPRRGVSSSRWLSLARSPNPAASPLTL